MKSYDAVIVGAGPAGLSAATYAAADGFQVALVEANRAGGQMRHSPLVENVVGMPGLSGQLIAEVALTQAENFGADYIEEKVGQIVPERSERGPHVVHLTSGFTLEAPIVLLAMGGRFNRLAIARDYVGRSVFYGDAWSRGWEYSGKDVLVVGGGNAAAQSVIYLASICRSVTVAIRQPYAAWSMYLKRVISKLDNVYLSYNSEVTAFEGEHGIVSQVMLNERWVPVSAVFILAGINPNNELSRALGLGYNPYNGNRITTGMKQVDWLHGFAIDRDAFSLETNIPGIFAAGDVRDSTGHGIAAAMGDGNVAASQFWQYLADCQQARFQALLAGSPPASLRHEPVGSASVATPR